MNDPDYLVDEFGNYKKGTYRRTKMSEEKTVKDEIDEEFKARNKLEDQLKKERARKERRLKMQSGIKNLQKVVNDFYTIADIPKNTCYLGGFADIYKGIERIQNAADWGEEHRHEDE